ncbi:hypothetical protein [Streptomyces lydicus]|uniref:hypothetical protein n=1 Tax=Streptomyces lydicus TaxID=47763 RepID=UPI00332821CB
MAALIVLLVSIAQGWTVLAVLAGATMVGTLVATTTRRRLGPPPDVTLRPGGADRPWRKPKD